MTDGSEAPAPPPPDDPGDARLFGPGAFPGPVPGLRVADGPEAVLGTLERMVVSRTWLDDEGGAQCD
jgi:hypothetical protein